MTDTLLKYLFRDAPVRAQFVRLHDAWQQILQNHDYPPAVSRLLGQLTAAATLLASNIKFSGALVLQIHGDGPVKLMVVECHADLTLRATAKLRADAVIAPDAGWRELVNAHGRGRCAITLDPRDRKPGQQPYQGIVALDGESVAEALETYMRQSEQLHTRLWLAADAATAAGVLLQRLPASGGIAPQATDDDDFQRAVTLAATLTPQELVAEQPATLARRLFWQEDLLPAEPLAPRFQCTCSRARIGRMLISLGRDEVESIIADMGSVSVTCDFCNARHEFDQVDVGQLFATGVTGAGDDSAQTRQ